MQTRERWFVQTLKIQCCDGFNTRVLNIFDKIHETDLISNEFLLQAYDSCIFFKTKMDLRNLRMLWSF